MPGILKMQRSENQVWLANVDDISSVTVSLWDMGTHYIVETVVRLKSGDHYNCHKKFESEAVARLEFQKEASNWEQFLKGVIMERAVEKALSKD